MNVTSLMQEALEWADFAFISAMTIQRESAHQIIARCKAASVKIVAGGPLFTSEYQHFETVDHFVLNEAELTLPPFLADLAQGCAQRRPILPISGSPRLRWPFTAITSAKFSSCRRCNP